MTELLVDAIYRAAPDMAAWPSVLQRIAGHFAADAAFLSYRSADGSTVVIASSGAANLLSALGVTPTSGRVEPTEDWAGQRTSATASFEIGGEPASLTVLTNSDRAALDQGDLSRLGAHVELALHVGLQREDQRADAHILPAVLDHLGIGAIVLGHGALILGANDTARAHFPQLLPNSSLTLPDMQAGDWLAAALATSDGRASRPVALARGIVVAQLMQFGTVAGREDETIRFGSPIAVLLLAPSSPERPISSATIKSQFGLTIAEARLTSLVANGHSVAEIAATLDITPGTARVVLQRVHQKLGVNRQAELVRRVSSLTRLGKS